VYGEAAAPPPGNEAASGAAGLRNMHYFAIVNPEMIDLWLRDRNGQIWLPAVDAKHTEQPQDKP
jgi:hypothetical protein